VRWQLACERQIAAHRWPQQKPESASTVSAAGATPTSGLLPEQQRLAATERSEGGAIAPSWAWGRDERQRRGGIGLVAIPTMPTSEARHPDPAPARFHVGEGGGGSFELRVLSFELNAARPDPRFTLIEPAGAPKAREGANRGLDGSSLPEKTRDATEAAERSDAAAGVDPGTETETGKGGIRNEE
jgi:hypothetical protein